MEKAIYPQQTSDKYGRIHLNHTPNHSIKTFTTDYNITQLKLAAIWTNAQTTITEYNLHLLTKCSRMQKIWTH